MTSSKEIDWTSPDHARLMGLDYYPVSADAIRLCDRLALEITANDPKRQRGRGVKQRHHFERAVGAFVADLLKAAERDQRRWSYRSLRREDFNDCHVSYRRCTSVVRGGEALRLFEREKGFYQRIDFGDGKAVGQGRATRFRATKALFAIAAEFAITPGNVEKHFRRGLPKKPLVLRAAAARLRNQKIRGKEIRFKPTSLSKRIEGEIRELNEFLRGFHLRGGTHRGYRRIFNQGTEEDYPWNQGGRLYSLGEDSYQSLKKDQRAAMRINNDPVVEVDIRASYLTILHAKKRITFDVRSDPYSVPGLPRDLVKAWVTMTLGHTGFHSRWPSAILKDYRDKGTNLSKAHPLKQVRAAILCHLPILEDWPKQKLSCFDLMYLEAEAMTRTMLELKRQHEIPSYSVHDSLIVPLPREHLASEVLKRNYKKVCGVEPFLVPNYPPSK